ncbi:unnamed protein product [Withania somnifera]
MVSTAFKAAAGTQNRTSFGGLKQLTTRIGYLTMAATFRCLQKNSFSIGTEDIEDVKRLCAIFDQVENLITLAASLHQKFLHAPCLAESIFNDYYNFYLPKMGTVSIGGDEKKREIIFSKCDNLSENYYASHAPRGYQQELETYRMYLCRTSNDLSVALAVASYD